MSAIALPRTVSSSLSTLRRTRQCHRAEPEWRVATRLHQRDIPAAVLPWLLDPASLTRRLQFVCHGAFRVQVIAQGWVRPQQNEAFALGMRERTWGFVREVVLRCNDRPWVYARTVIPRTTLTGPRRALTRLKTRPLGAVLFADPTLTRGPVEIAQLTPCDLLYPSAVRPLTHAPDSIWGRRSVFRLDDHPLLVSEIFLPGIPPCP